METKELSLDKFEEACEIVKEVASETKLVYSDYFSAQTGSRPLRAEDHFSADRS